MPCFDLKNHRFQRIDEPDLSGKFPSECSECGIQDYGFAEGGI